MQSQKLESEFQPEVRQLPAQCGLQGLLIGAIAVLSTVAIAPGADAASLTHWNFDPAANQLEITVKDGTTPRYFLMAQPARIVVDLPGTAVGDVSAQQTYSGAVRQIRVSQFEPGLTRIVLEISPGVSLAPGQVKLQKAGNAAKADNSRWVLSPLITKSLSTNTVSTNTVSTNTVSANTVTIKPSGQPVPFTAPAPLPTIRPLATSTATTQPPTSIVGNNLPAPPSTSPPSASPLSASNGAPANLTAIATASEPNRSNGMTATTTPTTPVALAPVLPAPPSSGTITTPLPPMTTPVDPNVAVDTNGGVAIAVPSPTVPPVSASANPISPQSAESPRAPDPAQMPRASASRLDRLLTTTTPTATGLTTEIPITVATASIAPAPSVSVPPLTVRESATLSAPDVQVQPNQSSTALEALPSLPTAPISQQPSVRVPPPIQVGTPSLGGINAAPPTIAVTAPLSISALGTVSETTSASVNVPPLQPSVAPPIPPSGATGTVYDANSVRVAPSSLPALPSITSSVNVPLQSSAVPSIPPAGATGTIYDANSVRRETASANLAPPIVLAPLQRPAPQPVVMTPTYDANTVKQPPVSAAPAPIVAFGQPLPASSTTGSSGQPIAALVNPSAGVRQAFAPIAPNVLLPSGTTLNLLYPGSTVLSLSSDRPQQEALMLQADLYDASGNLLAPAGSTVVGRFETTTEGSRFVTQAIAVTGRSLALTAQSEPLGDGTRKVTNTDLARNSGIGLLAGGVLGALGGSTGLGAIGGAAAGAATTLLSAPKPATIQPGQIVQVRLTQDFRQ